MARTRTSRQKASLLPLPGLEEFFRIPDTGARMAGIDEAGRGCLAGPVVAAAVCLPEGFVLEGLDDSKRLSEAERERLAPLIRRGALAWGIGIAWPQRIDEINILQATFEAMAAAYASLGPHGRRHAGRPAFELPPLVLVDGNRTIPRDLFARVLGARRPGIALPRQKAIVGGDALVSAISAASILAKVWRDRFMTTMGRLYPGYGFEVHKGYGTRAHYLALRALGPTPLHRLTFRGVTGTPHDSRPPAWDMPGRKNTTAMTLPLREETPPAPPVAESASPAAAPCPTQEDTAQAPKPRRARRGVRRPRRPGGRQ